MVGTTVRIRLCHDGAFRGPIEARLLEEKVRGEVMFAELASSTGVNCTEREEHLRQERVGLFPYVVNGQARPSLHKLWLSSNDKTAAVISEPD